MCRLQPKVPLGAVLELASVEDMHGGFSMESIKNPAEKAGHVNGLDRKSSIEALGARDLFQVRPLGDF